MPEASSFPWPEVRERLGLILEALETHSTGPQDAPYAGNCLAIVQSIESRLLGLIKGAPNAD